MKRFFYLLMATIGMSAFAEARLIRVERTTNDGYATARCPENYRLEDCDFNNNSTCDNTSEGWDYCRADSRNNRTCRITAYCRSREPRRVRIRGFTDHGYHQEYCPVGFRRESCSFDTYSCDNIRQGYDYCGADSRNNRDCHFSGICVETDY